jgi:hypothetical protein
MKGRPGGRRVAGGPTSNLRNGCDQVGRPNTKAEERTRTIKGITWGTPVVGTVYQGRRAIYACARSATASLVRHPRSRTIVVHVHCTLSSPYTRE